MKKLALLSLTFSLVAGAALADTKSFDIIIKDHKFTPETVEIPANEKVKLIVKNQDATPEEFESHDLKREKIVPANGEITVLIGPLKTGEYKFVGEHHEDTAKGMIVVK